MGQTFVRSATQLFILKGRFLQLLKYIFSFRKAQYLICMCTVQTGVVPAKENRAFYVFLSL